MTAESRPPVSQEAGPRATESRRGFLARLVALCGGAIALVTSGIGLTTFISPAFSRKSSGWVRVGRVDPESGAFPRSVAVSFRRSDGWLTATEGSLVHLVKNESGAIEALSSTCTHLGCRTHWDRETKSFLCPCHGGVYDAAGRVTAGPPPRALARLETRLEDEVLFVRGEDLGA
jgi:Rieske Fe-S protein